MAAPIALRTDYTAWDLRSLSRRTKDAGQARRLLALAVILDGGSRRDAALVGAVGLQTIRDWVLQFNAEGPAGLLTGTPPGRPPRLEAEHRAALARWVEDGPMPAVDGVVRWRLADLAQRLFEEFRIVIGPTALGRALRKMGYRKIAARPRHHAQDPAAAAAFKKTSRPSWRRLGPRRPGPADRDLVPKPALGPAKPDPGDEARIGQKNKITRRWARRGTRPVAPHDQRTRSAYIFGAICPKLGKGAGLVLPRCTTEAMQLHLDEIAQAVAPGAHAIVLLDQAGWHMTDKLAVPTNVSLLPIPPRSPELNPAENVWQFIRENWLSNRVFKSYADILDHSCFAWNTLMAQPWKIMSIGLRNWAHGS